MVASGYLIQTAVDGGWRKAWVAVHLITSVLWLAGYLAHQVPLLWQQFSRRRAGAAAPQTRTQASYTAQAPPPGPCCRERTRTAPRAGSGQKHQVPGHQSSQASMFSLYAVESAKG